MNKPTLSKYIESANYIKGVIKSIPDMAIILGSGLSGFAENLSNPIVIPYSEIPNFPTSTVSFHKGELVYGTIGDKKILCMNGRFHYYEGYEMWETAYPIATFKLMGINKLIITNAAGGIGDNLRIGDLVLVKDHIKFAQDSPCRGGNISAFGDRYFDMQRVYDKKFQALAHKIASELNIELKDGIYGYMTGPQFETPAEINMLKICGATVVGMSTVAEVIMAAQCSIPVLCISCVTNMAAGITGASITDQEVIDTGNSVKATFNSLILEFIKRA